MRNRLAFRQVDLQRVLKAAKTAGFDADEVTISPAGEIRLRRAGGKSETPADIAEELERHFRAKR